MAGHKVYLWKLKTEHKNYAYLPRPKKWQLLLLSLALLLSSRLLLSNLSTGTSPSQFLSIPPFSLSPKPYPLSLLAASLSLPLISIAAIFLFALTPIMAPNLLATTILTSSPSALAAEVSAPPALLPILVLLLLYVSYRSPLYLPRLLEASVARK